MEIKTCFVIMPFSGTTQKHTEQYWDSFYDVIKSEMELLGIQCRRSETGPHNIIKQVISHLNTSDVAVAVLTDLNPNVWYELGIRHALREGTLMLLEEGQKVPFDISAYGLIKYADDITLANRLRVAIKSYLDKLHNNPFSDSPVLDAIGLPARFQSKLDAMYDMMVRIASEGNKAVPKELVSLHPERTRVLWVDDYPSNVMEIVDMFEGRSIRFDMAISTAQALELMAEHDYDMVITDMGRHGQKDAGIQLIKEIRVRFPRFSAPIIVFASEEAVITYGDQAVRQGALSVVSSVGEVIAYLSSIIAV